MVFPSFLGDALRINVKATRNTPVRVGGGDSFASGLIYGFLAGHTPQESLQLGIAHGALAMTTPGDTSMVSLAEVQKLAAGGNARVER